MDRKSSEKGKPMKNIQKEEAILKSHKFKKVWLDDKSGYWFEKKVHKWFKYYTEPDTDRYYLDICFSPRNYSTIDFKNLNTMLKSLKKFKFEY